VDGFAILLAVEFAGLLNHINDVNFARNGGWWQPLPSLEEQSLTIFNIFRAWFFNLALWMSMLTVTPVIFRNRSLGNNELDVGSWGPFLIAFSAFASFRLVLVVLDNTIALETALLDTYIVGLLLGTARYILGNETQ
jgi:hypothetical protein